MKSIQLLLCLASVACSYPDTDELLAKTSQGLIRGIEANEHVNAFLGIPYAEPPVGQLRWKPPQRLKSNDDKKVFNASEFGNSCYQFHYDTVFYNPEPLTPQSEDCLTLNVFVPRGIDRGKKGLPVFVWQHGGGFVEGSSSVPINNPSKFVQEAKDIIVVITNYRLSLFGYPNTPGLPSDGQNVGIRDQRAALEWVRDNIAAFGGNPEHIVHGGESAGAGITDVLAYQYPDDPIFTAVILQSGTVQLVDLQQYTTDSEFVRIAQAVGCNHSDRKQELDCMKTIPFDVLRKAISNKTANAFGDGNGGSPCVDNVTVFSSAEYTSRTLAGKFAHVPTLIGTTDREGDSCVDIGPDGPNRTQADAVTTFTFNCPAALGAAARASHGIPVWRYRFKGVFPSVTSLPTLGAYHGVDIYFQWGSVQLVNPSVPIQPNEAEASKYLMRVFAAFIRDPVAGLTREFHWPTYNESKNTLIELFTNQTATGRLVDPLPYDTVCNSMRT